MNGSMIDKEFANVIATSGGSLGITAIEVKNCNQIADAIQQEKTLIYCDGWYEFEQGVFLPVKEDRIKRYVKDKLQEAFTQFKANEILHSLRVDVAVGDPEELNASKLLNLKNGMFDLDALELLPHSPDYKSTIQLPVNYSPDAMCFKWFKALKEIFCDDIEKADMLQEFFGLCLTKDQSQEKALFLIGEGGNGKTVILYVIQQILGERNYSSVPLELFNNPHYTANFRNKLANISIETNAKSSVYDSLMKAVVSGDMISADFKYQNVVQFRPFCKLIFATNNMPRVDDKTDAFYRRLIVVRFKRQFTEEEQNKKLKDELMVEADGIFFWMIEGLKRLRKRGYFELSKGIKDEIAEYRKENNNAMTFIEEECELDVNLTVSKTALYEAYSNYCKTNGHRPLSQINLGKEIVKQYKLNKDDRDVTGKRVWNGIGFKK